MAKLEPSGWGTIAHGTATAGLTAVLLRAGNQSRRSAVMQCQGPGNAFFGGASVSATNSPKVKPDGALTLDNNGADIYVIADQAATTITFLEELAP